MVGVGGHRRLSGPLLDCGEGWGHSGKPRGPGFGRNAGKGGQLEGVGVSGAVCRLGWRKQGGGTEDQGLEGREMGLGLGRQSHSPHQAPGVSHQKADAQLVA